MLPLQPGFAGQAFATVVEAEAVCPAAKRPDGDRVDIPEAVHQHAFAGAFGAAVVTVPEDEVACGHVPRPYVKTVEAGDCVVEKHEVVGRQRVFQRMQRPARPVVLHMLRDAAQPDIGLHKTEHMGDRGGITGGKPQHHPQVFGVFLAGPTGADAGEMAFGEGREGGPAGSIRDRFEHLDQLCGIGRVDVDRALGAFGHGGQVAEGQERAVRHGASFG